MRTLSGREEEIMNMLWNNGPMFVREMLNYYDEPRPHFNTISTIVRILEEKGYVSHHSVGNSYQYYAVLSRSDFGKSNLQSIVAKYFKNSYRNVVSAFVREENISIDELKELIAEIKKEGEGSNSETGEELDNGK